MTSKRAQLLAAPDVVAKRKATCKTCPHRAGFFCGKCGCPIASKTHFQRAACPAGHW